MTKQAKRTISYIKGVKKKLIKRAKKVLFDDSIGEKEWYKARAMLKGDPYFNFIISDFSEFIFTLKEDMKRKHI